MWGYHPAVADVVFAGRPSGLWGSEFFTVLSLRPGRPRPGDDELRAHCRAALARYKVPKAFHWVDRVARSPAGKADYTWARSVAAGGDTAGQANSSVV